MAYKTYAVDGNGPINVQCKSIAGLNGVIADEEILISEVRLHLSAASAAEDFVITLDSSWGERYDIVLDKEAMSGLADYVWIPTRPAYVRTGDGLVITKANAAGLVWSVVVIYD